MSLPDGLAPGAIVRSNDKRDRTRGDYEVVYVTGAGGFAMLRHVDGDRRDTRVRISAFGRSGNGWRVVEPAPVRTHEGGAE